MKSFLLFYIGYFLKTFVFDVNVGNDDWEKLYDPNNYQLDDTVNLYLDGFQNPDHRIGAWFIKPLSGASQKCKEGENCELDPLFNTAKLSKDDTVFVLLHGNGRNRGAAHRLAAYKTFQNLGFYTITIDYRHYGDSSKLDSFGDLSDETIVEDAANTIRQLRKRLGNDFQLLLYGHSMGTGVSAHAASQMQDEGVRVDGIILDSGFHSIRNSIEKMKGHWFNDYLNKLIDMPSLMESIGLGFDTSTHINKLRCPVRLFHAEVDHVVPISESEDMYRDAKASGKTNIDFIRFTEEGLGHIGISTTKGFQEQIADFAQLAKDVN